MLEETLSTEIHKMVRWLAILTILFAFTTTLPACGGTSGGGDDHDDDDDGGTPENRWDQMLWDQGEWQ